MPFSHAETDRASGEAPRPANGGAFALDMQVGSRVMLQPAGMGEKIWGEAVGMVQDKFILIRIPTNPALRQSLVQDTPVTVRYIVRDCLIFGFTSTVAALNTNPLPILYLHIPKQVEKANLRTHDRVNCYLPASVFVEGQEFQGPMVDISKGGCKILLVSDEEDSAAIAPLGTEVFCQLQILGAEGALFLKGIVKKSESSDGKTLLGVAFEDLPEEAAEHIERYVRCVNEHSEL